MDNMFFTRDQFAPETLENGVVRTVKGYIGDLMVVELRWKRGMEGAVHTHPHRQCSYILKGVFEASVGGEKKLLSAGECVYVEAGVRTVCWRGRRTACCSTSLRPCGRIL